MTPPAPPAIGAPDAASAGAPAPAPEDAGAAVQAPAGPGATEIQQEFDQQLASLFMASDEVDMELEVARVRSDARRQTAPVYSDLDQARERFINELHELKRRRRSGTAHPEFSARGAARAASGRQAGGPRPRGGFSGGLPREDDRQADRSRDAAPALSRAIVDAGLKLLTLEASPQDEAKAAASAVAATVEETVRRVSALPDYVLDNQELLEGFALEAFEQSAAANLPPVLSEAVYRERPDLLESQGVKTCWVMLPLRRRKRYKKCARTFKVRITPYMADEIESFEGPLSDYLQDQLGVEEGAEVEAEVQLFETLPGTTLPDIAREESETPGGRTAGAPERGAAPSAHAEGRRACCSASRGWGVTCRGAHTAGMSASVSVSIVCRCRARDCSRRWGRTASRTRAGLAAFESPSIAPKTRFASASS